MCTAVDEPRQFLQIQVRPTEKGMRMESAHGQDRERMAAAKEGGRVAVYTDGSTAPRDGPTAGWGWVQYEEGGSALGNRTGEGKGRLGGEQNSYKAEA